LLAAVTDLCAISLETRLATLRKQRGLIQPTLADQIGIHVFQLRRCEASSSQPTLNVLRRLALNVSADLLMFDEGERTIPDTLAHHLEAIDQLDPKEQQAIHALIEGALLRHQARRRLAAS
jgi:transcriptional regulator with XRE-family HTH domain